MLYFVRELIIHFVTIMFTIMTTESKKCICQYFRLSTVGDVLAEFALEI